MSEEQKSDVITSYETDTGTFTKNNPKSVFKKDIVCSICLHGSSNAIFVSHTLGFICPSCSDAIAISCHNIANNLHDN